MDIRKNIRFTFAVNRVELASDERKYVMVNWIHGTVKNNDGTVTSTPSMVSAGVRLRKEVGD